MDRNELLGMLGSVGWSNSACMGYVIQACRALDYPESEISALLKALKAMFSNHSVEEAEQTYRDF